MKKLLILSAAIMVLLCGCEKKAVNEDGVVINGVRWATRNVDAPGTFAETPESAGMLYQWNKKIGWSAADPIKNSNGSTKWDDDFPSGNEWSNKNDPSPNGWRVPTLSEIKTLLDINKVSANPVLINVVKEDGTEESKLTGYLFTDKITGNTLFLPAIGVRLGDNNGSISGNGQYWSNTRYSDITDFSAFGIVRFTEYAGLSRRDARPVRPVAK
jgi:hypothetical protein